MDRCSVIELDEEEEDDDFEDEESETASEGDNESVATMRWERIGDGRWMVCSSSSLAHENLRSLFGPLNDLDAEEPEDPRIVAARKIQAIFRGNQVRNTHGAAVNLLRLFQQAYEL